MSVHFNAGVDRLHSNLNTPPVPSPVPSTGSLTFALFFRLENNLAAKSTLVAFQLTTGADFQVLGTSSDGLTLQFDDGGTVLTGPTLSVGVNYFACVECDGVTNTLTVRNMDTLAAPSVFSGAGAGNRGALDELFIGAHNIGGTGLERCDASLSGLTIWGVTGLFASQIDDYLNPDLTGVGGLFGYYPLVTVADKLVNYITYLGFIGPTNLDAPGAGTWETTANSPVAWHSIQNGYGREVTVQINSANQVEGGPIGLSRFGFGLANKETGVFGAPTRLSGPRRPRYFAKAQLIYPFTWGLLSKLPKSIKSPGAGKLADGRCLTFGGRESTDFADTPVPDSYLFAADGLSFVQVGDYPFSNTFAPLTALLGDGRLLVVDFNNAATFDPGTLTWTARTAPPFSVNSGALVSLTNGNALLLEGSVGTGVREYVSGTNTWSARASTQLPHQYVSAVRLPSGEIFIDSFEGTSSNNGKPEIYNYGSNTWSFAVNDPHPNNHCQTLVVQPDGKLFTCSTSVGFVIFADRFDPATKLFTPLPQHASAHAQGVFVNPNGYFLGENLIIVLDPYIPRPAWFNIGTEIWSGGSFDSNPALTYNGESFGGGVCFYLGEAGGTLGFLRLGFDMQTEGLQVPHFGGRYVELSQFKNDDGHAPTFAGVVSVVQGTEPTKVFVTWANGSDTLTDYRDLNYYVFVSQSPGGENFNSPTRSTEIWAGSLSREIVNLTVGVTHYFVVRARNMIGKNQPGNTETNVVELSFTPGAVSAPVFSWTPTQSMIVSRIGAQSAYLADGRYLIWGGIFTPGIWAGGGEIYSQTGLVRVPDQQSPPAVEGASIDSSPEEEDLSFGVAGHHHRATSIGGQFGPSTITADVQKYFPYAGSWLNNDFLVDGGTDPFNMNEAVMNHAAVPLPDGDILRLGGRTVVGSPASTVNTAERMTFATFTLSYNGLVTPFTVGAILTGVDSAARAKIIAVNVLGPTDGTLEIKHLSDLTIKSGEFILDNSGGEAQAGFFAVTPYFQTWAFVAPMNVKRSQHEAICLTGHSLSYAGFGTVDFVVTEVITGATSGATGTVTAVVSTGNLGAVELTNVVGEFIPLEHITGSIAGDSFTNKCNVYRSHRVLVVGGTNQLGVPHLTAEVYDSIANTWSSLIATSGAHYQFKLVTLRSGKVLCISGGSAAVDLFNPDTNTFSAAASLPVGRTEFTAHLFGGGQVGVFGGRTAGVVDEVLLYDPGLDSWTFKNPMLTARARHVSFLMPNNKVLVAGGEDAVGASISAAEISS